MFKHKAVSANPEIKACDRDKSRANNYSPLHMWELNPPVNEHFVEGA